MDDLRPCPWCKVEPAIWSGKTVDGAMQIGPDGVYIGHSSKSERCLFVTPRWFPSRAAAIAAWNRRADDWIPVEERLPNAFVAVLVRGGLAVYDPDKGWRTLMDGYDSYDRAPLIRWLVDVWRPLPDPPEVRDA